MRRKDREMKNQEDILTIIREEGVVRLAIKDEPYPYIIPMNYGSKVEDGQVTLYFHSAREGRKIDLLKKNPQVGFEIDRNKELVYENEKGSCSMLYECVVGYGDIEFVEGEELMEALKLILKQHGRGEEFVILDSLVKVTTCFKLVVKEYTGKKH